jgi:hypothetical protein
MRRLSVWLTVSGYLVRSFSCGLRLFLSFRFVSYLTIILVCGFTISLVCGFVPSRGDLSHGTGFASFVSSTFVLATMYKTYGSSVAQNPTDLSLPIVPARTENPPEPLPELRTCLNPCPNREPPEPREPDQACLDLARQITTLGY